MGGYLPDGCMYPSDIDQHMATRAGGRFATCPECNGDGMIDLKHEHDILCVPGCRLSEDTTVEAICPVCAGTGTIDREEIEDL